MAMPSQEMVRTWTQATVRCCPAALLLLLGFLTLYIIHVTECTVSGKAARDYAWIIGFTDLVIYVWIRAFARVSLRMQIAALVVIYGSQLCLYLAVRIDGFMGDGRPIVVWRWTRTADERWEAIKHDELSTDNLGATETADLETITSFDYPAFRGTDHNGTVRNVTLARNWSHPPRKLWRRSVGAGWSSFAVVGNYCVTQEQRGDYEAVVCYELQTGRQVWEHLDRACFDEVTGGAGPRSTPTIHDGYVFSLGATGILNCLEGRNGRQVWSKNILEDNHTTNRIFGMSGSPLVLNGVVVVGPGGKEGSLVAYDQQTGKRVWAGGDAEASYSSPQFAPFHTRHQILNFNAEGLFGHDAESGKVLWSYGWVSNPAEKNNVCQPVPLLDHEGQNDQVFISSGYDKGCALFDIVQHGTQFEVQRRWSNRNLKAKFSSVVMRDDHVYGLDERIMVCIDLATGNRCWKRGRYGYGQLVLVDDVLLVQAESGDVVLVEASPHKHRELARFTALNHRTWNHPALSGNMLLVRNDREAACYELPLADGASKH